MHVISHMRVAGSSARNIQLFMLCYLVIISVHAQGLQVARLVTGSSAQESGPYWVCVTRKIKILRHFKFLNK
jgi:hypothetical protein